MIKILVLDVDGTLTDGKIYMGADGEVFKAFDIKDGCGIHDILPKYNIVPVVITGRSSEIVKNRCKELNIKHLYQGIRDKKKKICDIVESMDYSLENVAYMGDDIIDLEAMSICGVSGAPADASESVIKVADFVSKYTGGNGAVRDFIEWLVERYSA